MSFILDALKKSERDRETAVAQPPPALRRTLAAEPVRGTSKWLTGLAVLAIGVLAGAGVWYYLAATGEPEKTEAVDKIVAEPEAGDMPRKPPTSNTKSNPGPNTTPNTTPGAMPAHGLGRDADSGRQRAVPQSPGGSPEREAGPHRERHQATATRSESQLRETPARPRDEQGIGPQTEPVELHAESDGPDVEEPKVVDAEPAKPVAESMGDTGPGTGAGASVEPDEGESAQVLDLRASARATRTQETEEAKEAVSMRLGRMPYAVQKAVAPLILQVHVYDDDPQRCFVMINGNTYTAGGEIKPGLHLDAIVPEGVVLLWKGQRFLLTPRD